MNELNGSGDGPYQTKATIVARHLRKAIISGQTPVGASLRQEHIAAELGLSSTPVREALRILEAEGFVRAVPHQGVRVAPRSREHLKVNFELRRQVEGLAAELAAERITEEEIVVLRRLCSEMESCVASGDHSEIRGLDFEFHEAINRATKVPQIQTIINYLWSGLDWAILETNTTRLKRSLDEHRVLLDALEQRNGPAAREAMVRQILNSEADEETLCDPHREYGQHGRYHVHDGEMP